MAEHAVQVPTPGVLDPVAESPLRAFGGQPIPVVPVAMISDSIGSIPSVTAEEYLQSMFQNTAGVAVVRATSKASRYRTQGTIVTDVAVELVELLYMDVPPTVTTLGGQIGIESLHAHHSSQLELGVSSLIDVRIRTDGEVSVRSAWPVTADSIVVRGQQISLSRVREIQEEVAP